MFADSIATSILVAGEFYPAEEYHQDFYVENPDHDASYSAGSGRKDYLKSTWGSRLATISCTAYPSPTDAALREQLTSLQHGVTRQNGTEPAFANEFWDNKAEGLYVDIVSGEPLFSSTSKFASGTGWPSFTQPVAAVNIVEKSDPAMAWREQRCAVHAPIHIWGMYSPTARRPHIFATA